MCTRGRQASCGSNTAEPGFSPSKLIYDHQKGSGRTGQTISTILKHESKKKDQYGMGMIKLGQSGVSLPVLGETRQILTLGLRTQLPKMCALG